MQKVPDIEQQPAETSTLKQTNIVDVNGKQLATKTERMVN